MKKFLPLFRYYLFANPWIWSVPIMVGIPSFTGTRNRYFEDVGMAFAQIGPMLWVPLFVAVFIFAIEVMAWGPAANTSGFQGAQALGSEFILTRAVDRRSVFWARNAAFWIMILLPALVWVGAALLNKPSFTLELFPKDAAKAPLFLQHFSGSFIETTKSNNTVVIQAPTGALTISLWCAGFFLAAAALWQCFVFFIINLRHRRWLFWGVFAAWVVALPFGIIYGRKGFQDYLFFAIDHAPLMVLGFFLLAGFASWYGPRQFAKLEFA